jgi:hypothetical protein
LFTAIFPDPGQCTGQQFQGMARIGDAQVLANQCVMNFLPISVLNRRQKKKTFYRGIIQNYQQVWKSPEKGQNATQGGRSLTKAY